MKKIYLILIVLVTFSISCTKNFEEFNTDTKNPAEVEGEYLFSQAQKQLVDQIYNTNVNWNIWKLIAQYWTETTYTDEANYDIINRNIPEQIYTAYYRNVLKPLQEAKMLIEADPPAGNEDATTISNKLHIIDIIEVYCYHNLVNIFGDVPYSEALNIENINPKYDDAATIYADLFDRIDADIAGLQTGGDIESFGSADLIFNGDVQSWIDFANSLKLKMAMCLADVDETTAKAHAEEAISNGVLTYDAAFPYQGAMPNANQLYVDLVASGRKDFVPANTIVEIMKGFNDPRMDNYFTNQVDTSSDGVDNPIWLGGVYGASNTYANYSHINPTIEDPAFPGILISNTEMLFYTAEAAARGWTTGTTAKDAYDQAVTSSILDWSGSTAEATNYLDSVANYDTLLAAGQTWQEIIGTQAYIGFYVRGLVAYNVYRRLDYPQMNVAPDARTPNGEVPTRFTYPVNEQTLNATNYYDAADAIGGDAMTTRLFWDVADPE